MGSNAQRSGLMALVIAAAALIAWLSWAWSPSVETRPVASEAPALPQAEPSPPVVKSAPAKAPAVYSPPELPAAAPAESPEPKPERIPTPHPMSLDQAKPPEEFGPLAQLKQQYDSESRSAESSATEAKLREMITVPNIPPALVQDISCRRNLCKLAVHWEPRRRIGMAVLLESFKQLYPQRVAVEPAPERSADGTYLTTLYVRLNP